MSVTCCHGNTNQKCSDCGARFLRKWREKFFVVAREFFSSRTKSEKFTRHVLRNDEYKKSGA
nr:DUF1661 domain-containing protein [Porphyromonas gulae]